MLVKYWMNTPVMTIEHNRQMLDAMRLMKKHHIGRLPVTRSGSLVGIITTGDIRQASASDATSLEIHELLYLLEKINVNEVMTANPLAITAGTTVEEAAEIMLTHRISGLPVVNDGGSLIGIITQNDLFRVLIMLTGAAKKGLQIALQLPDQPGQIGQAVDCMRAYGGRIVSILTSHGRAPDGHRIVYFRMIDLEWDRFDDLRGELLERFNVLYIIDHRHQRRHFFDEALEFVGSGH